MKRIKKLASLLLAVVMVLSMTVAAFAEGETSNPKEKHTITITNDKSGHHYEAYQVFSGVFFDDNGSKKLSEIEWGDGVDDTKLLNALKGITSGVLKDKFSECSTAEDVSDVLNTFKDDESGREALDAFAEIVGGCLTDKKHDSQENDKTYTIGNLDDGYYLVKDRNNSLDGPNGNGDAYTKYIMYVVDNVTVRAKADAPFIDKVIETTKTDGTTEDTKTNNGQIGDTVYFKVTSKMPEMTGYKKYFFVVNDTLSKGLTFNENSVNITINGNKLNDGHTNDYTVTATPQNDGSTEIKIVFKDFVKRTETKGSPIVIKYNATINEAAIIGTTGNPNTVDLIYSNNPNVDADPDNDTDEPGGEDPVGETPKSTTYTYVTGLELIKIDGTTKEALSGAVFTISGIKTDNKVIVYDAVYEKNDNGKYYKLKDGSYTTDEPQMGEGGNSDLYDNPEQKYEKKTNKVDTITVTDEVKATGTVKDGVLQFDGLGAGKYVITEVTAPNGYNLLDAPIDIEIEWKAPEDLKTSQDCQWTIKDNKGKVLNGIVQVTIENKSGALLPSTGGIGTTIFYAAGIILMAGAVFFVVRRKRA